jgi:hypothetical protein
VRSVEAVVVHARRDDESETFRTFLNDQRGFLYQHPNPSAVIAV